MVNDQTSRLEIGFLYHKNLEAKSLTWLKIADQSETEEFAVRSRFAETGKIEIKNERK